MPDSYANAAVLVSTQWVADHLDDPSVRIAEVNTDLKAGYLQGHVPGAVGWSLHVDLEDQTRRDVPSMRQLEALLGRSGIDNQSTIVVYGDGNNRSATWAFWVLKYYRHRDLRLMNGGRKKWVDESRPLSPETPVFPPKQYRAGVPDLSIRATREYILRNLRSPWVKLLDTRSYEEYAGLLSSAPGGAQAGIYRLGRVPGAVHVPWDDGATPDGTFRPTAELARLYEDKGFSPDREVIAYCRLGVRASFSWFVLRYLLAYERVRNYDGSWTEWGNSAGVPIETDAAPSSA